MRRLLAVGAVLALLASSVSAQTPPDDFSWMLKEGKLAGIRSIPSMSMAPTILEGDRVAVVTPNRQLRRGDILIFRHPTAPGRVMIDRLIGLPGDAVEMKDGILYLNDAPAGRVFVREVTYFEPANPNYPVSAYEYREQLPGEEQPHLIHEFSDSDSLDVTPRFVVPEGKLFFMGDNRDNSEDSRAPSGHRQLATQFPQHWPYRAVSPSSDPRDAAIGFVPTENVMGRVVTVIWSMHACNAKAGAAVRAECLKPQINKRL